jgi:TPP-dependent indolepyruvate ferredoxin oxidoreductase alpha subunit
VAVNDRIKRLEDAYPEPACEEPTCGRVYYAHRRLLPGGREEYTGERPPELCEGCPERDNPNPPIRYFEVRLDYRGGYYEG